MKRIVMVACAAAGMLACAPAGGGGAMVKMNDPADLAAVGKVRSDFVAAFNAGDTTALAGVFTADAQIMDNAQPTAVGGAAYASAVAAMRAQMAAVSVEATPTKTEVVGDVAYENGTYRTSATPKAGGAPMVEEGRYLVVLRRQADGTWKLVEDMGNLPTAPTMPAPAPGK